jgi:hypothetical protein
MESQAVEKTQSIIMFKSQTMQTQVHNEDEAKDESFPQPHGKTMNRVGYENKTKDAVFKKLFSKCSTIREQSSHIIRHLTGPHYDTFWISVVWHGLARPFADLSTWCGASSQLLTC